MSTKKIIRWAREARIDNAPAKHLLLVLATHADSEGLISPGPSWATLTQETTLSRTTIYKALRALEDHELIVKANRERANGSQTSCEYLLAVVASAEPRPVHETNGYQFTRGTGTRSRDEPVHETNGSTRSPGERVLNSENAETRSGDEPPRSPGEPPEEKIPTTTPRTSTVSESVTRASRTRAREATNDRPTVEQLNATGVRDPRAYTILARWRAGHAQTEQGPYSLSTYRELGPHIDDALAKGKDEATVLDALRRWDNKGSKARPGLLPNLIDDVDHDKRAADDPNRVWVDRSGRPLAPPDQIPDHVITYDVIEQVLGADTGWYPEIPEELIEESGPRYIAFNEQLRIQRLAERQQQVRDHWVKYGLYRPAS